MSDLRGLLDLEDEVLDRRWERLDAWLRQRFGRDNTIESVLFLIGVHSRGLGFTPKLEKEEKQGLIMEGTYLALETLGHYERIGMEADGSWIWEKRVELPQLTVEQQEKLLRIGITNYFEQFVETGSES
ncbi:MAG: hypothetical protein R3282_00055 [Rhodothermales bacterium]|nr:hypothetical protein [Rhodothermales bacterium]